MMRSALTSPLQVEGETVIRGRDGAHENPVLVHTAAQVEMRGDLGVEIADKEFLVQADR